MYLLVFIHLAHNIRFWPARCVKSLLPTPQPSLLPLQWEKRDNIQRKCRCLSPITRNSIAQCVHLRCMHIRNYVDRGVYCSFSILFYSVAVQITHTRHASGLQGSLKKKNSREENNPSVLDSSSCRLDTMFVGMLQNGHTSEVHLCCELRIYSYIYIFIKSHEEQCLYRVHLAVQTLHWAADCWANASSSSWWTHPGTCTVGQTDTQPSHWQKCTPNLNTIKIYIYILCVCVRKYWRKWCWK